MDIDQLDPEEKNKIAALLRERQNNNNEKGVDYIFKAPDVKEEFLLGKKVDIDDMVQNDKGMFGESEADFKARMDRRHKMDLLRLDPLVVINSKEQAARKFALQRKQIHEKLVKKANKKQISQRNTSSSSSSSDDESDDCLSNLKNLLFKTADSDDDIFENRNSNEEKSKHQKRKSDNNSNYSTEKRRRHMSNHDNHKKSADISKSPNRSRNHKKHTHDSESKTAVRNRKSKSRSPCHRRIHDKHDRRRQQYKSAHHRSRTPNKPHKSSHQQNDHRKSKHHKRGRSPPSSSYHNTKPISSKLSQEELEARRRKMQDSSRSIEKMRSNYWDKYNKQSEKEDEQLKNSNMNEEFFLLESRLHQSNYSLEHNIKSKVIQSKLKR